MMGGLRFPESADDLTAAFNNALAAGAMQLSHPELTTFWARHELLAHDVEDGVDVFYNSLSGLYVRVERKESE